MSSNRFKISNHKKQALIKANQKETSEQLLSKIESFVHNPLNLRFDDLPISQLTLKGLASSNYNEMTDIQRNSLCFSLKGKDILGAAKTGCGKTLAYIIPVLEILFTSIKSILIHLIHD